MVAGTCLIPELWRQDRQGLSEFEASLICVSEFKVSQDYVKRPCLKTKQYTHQTSNISNSKGLFSKYILVTEYYTVTKVMLSS